MYLYLVQMHFLELDQDQNLKLLLTILINILYKLVFGHKPDKVCVKNV